MSTHLIDHREVHAPSAATPDLKKTRFARNLVYFPAKKTIGTALGTINIFMVIALLGVAVYFAAKYLF
jgi:hypothetical protein